MSTKKQHKRRQSHNPGDETTSLSSSAATTAPSSDAMHTEQPSTSSSSSSSSAAAKDNRPRKKGPASDKPNVEEEENELEFEDPFEDEVEQEDQQEAQGEEDDDDEEEEDDEEGAAEADAPESIKKKGREKHLGKELASKTKSSSSKDALEVDENSNDRIDGSKRVYRPGIDEIDPTLESNELDYDSTAYTMLHRLKMDWPCLSFDVLPDTLGQFRTKFPHTMYIVCGSQADAANKNKVSILKISDLHKTKHDDENEDEDDDDDDDPDDLDDDPILEEKSFAHHGGVNRIRVMPQNSHIVATWAETGAVHIWNIKEQLLSLDKPGMGSSSVMKNPKITPLYTFKGHAGEGFAMDWSSRVSGRLLTGDCQKYIYIWNARASGDWVVEKTPFKGHAGSVEDLAWSPAEDNVFASCSVDKTVRIWDSRVRDKCAAWVAAHKSDVNVISWNKREQHLLASGCDDGSIKVWDLRKFTSKDFLANFAWHKGAITSLEWHPSDESVLCVSSADNSISIWDMALEEDAEEVAQHATGAPATGLDLPPQLFFIHQGQSNIKEVHWHSQIPGTVISTAEDGFNIFRPSNLDQ